MDTDNLDFLDGETPAEAQTAVSTAEAPAATPASEPTEGPARGPDGKFVSKASDTPSEAPQTPAITPEAAQPAPVASEPAKAPDGFVPLSAFTALRDDFNNYKRQQQPAQPPPDIYEDPDGYAQHASSQIVAERTNWSRRLAEATYGAETVTQAQQWAERQFASDPVFAQRAMTSDDPYGFAIGEWKRDTVLQKLTDPTLIDKFLAFASGQAPAQAQPIAAPAALPQTPTPPRSLASAPSAEGIRPGETPVGPGVAFAHTFKE